MHCRAAGGTGGEGGAAGTAAAAGGAGGEGGAAGTATAASGDSGAAAAAGGAGGGGGALGRADLLARVDCNAVPLLADLPRLVATPSRLCPALSSPLCERGLVGTWQASTLCKEGGCAAWRGAWGDGGGEGDCRMETGACVCGDILGGGGDSVGGQGKESFLRDGTLG